MWPIYLSLSRSHHTSCTHLAWWIVAGVSTGNGVVGWLLVEEVQVLLCSRVRCCNDGSALCTHTRVCEMPHSLLTHTSLYFPQLGMVVGGVARLVYPAESELSFLRFQVNS